MDGAIVYADTSVASTDGEISINHHTSSIHLLNLSSSTDAIVKLNGTHQVLIPHTPTQSGGIYTCVPGDYTKFEVLTSSVTISVFAIG
mgnify:FL=1